MHAQMDGEQSPTTAQLSDGSTAPMSSAFAPGAVTRELQKLDVLAEQSEMDGSQMAGLGMGGEVSLMHADVSAVPEHQHTVLSTQPSLATGINPSRHLAMMYGSASQFPSQFPDGHSKAPFSGYIPDGDSEHVLSTFGNTGNNTQPVQPQHLNGIHHTVPEHSGMSGGSGHMTGTSGSALGPSARLPVASAVVGGSRSGVSGGYPRKPPPVAVLQSMSSRGGPSDMGHFSEELLPDVPGASESTGVTNCRAQVLLMARAVQ
jgi:hypothetical protein